MDLLTIIVNEYIKINESWSYNLRQYSRGIKLPSLMSFIYTDRIHRHPSYMDEFLKHGMILDSFVKSADLELKDDGYHVTAQALGTLEKYNSDLRRHEDAVKMQKRMLWVTIIIAFAAIVQACSVMVQVDLISVQTIKSFGQSLISWQGDS